MSPNEKYQKYPRGSLSSPQTTPNGKIKRVRWAEGVKPERTSLFTLSRNQRLVAVVAAVLLHITAVSYLTSAPALSTLPQATIRNGTYEGLHSSTFNQDFFLGIPYAQDTSGPNRFRVPQSLNTTWSGTRPAKQYGHACPGDTPDGDDKYGMSENCLSINIVRPAGNNLSTASEAKLPVLFWIHGGSYQIGTSGWDRYNLSYIVQHSVEIGRPLMAVSINYRKGGWGFLYSNEVKGSGNTNLALRDMRLALAWAQENLGAFGGDTSRVTIWGESAGSFAVGQLLMSYGGRTDGLFHRSIQESGSTTTAWYNGTEWYQPIYDRLVSATGCADAVDTLDCLRTVPYPALYQHLVHPAGPGKVPSFYPVVDGDLIPQYPSLLLHSGRFAHMPHIIGTNSDEGTDNAPRGLSTPSSLSTYLLHRSGFNYPSSVVTTLLSLYPDDPAQGIPLNTGAERFASLGNQYKRAAALVGDIFYHAPRLDDARHYARHQPHNTFVYRFNARAWVPPAPATTANFSVDTACRHLAVSACGSLAPAHEGVAHATELAFVFGNPKWLGPWPGHGKLSREMSEMWIHFAHDGTPNRRRAEEVWPPYASGGAGGRNLVLQTEEQGGLYVEKDTWRLEGRELMIKWARRRHV
ncbi:Alpha/Beta hydrolase protein [Lasiosphaeria hispida]|uniref:Carboxylic ester hydrolase n=1 Tax=Lasiosphaeria hispida TaxID=260671 RepID=A0AAJ0MBZ9_9PEZI|nr:Alpha/Beta hydrolase protein [Lasiosphaeria hispida]